MVTALDQLSAEHGDTKAGIYKVAVLTFEFNVALVAVEHVLQALVPLSNVLQSEDCDLVKAGVDTRVVYALLQVW